MGTDYKHHVKNFRGTRADIIWLNDMVLFPLILVTNIKAGSIREGILEKGRNK